MVLECALEIGLLGVGRQLDMKGNWCVWCGVEKWSCGMHLGMGSCGDTVGLICFLRGVYQWLGIVECGLGVSVSGL